MIWVGARGGKVAVRKGEFWTISVGPCPGGRSASAVAGWAENRRTRRPLEMQTARCGSSGRSPAVWCDRWTVVLCDGIDRRVTGSCGLWLGSHTCVPRGTAVCFSGDA